MLAAAGSVVGLWAPEAVYGEETAALADSAAAQDLVNLVLVAPLMAATALAASRGSLRSWLCLVGFQGFTVYNYAIYAFSIHFGPLFLLWVAVLGLSLFALIGTLAALDSAAVRARFIRRSMALPGSFLVAVASLFVLLWLSEIVPDLAAGRPSRSARDWNVPTNPVHVLDLAFFLPAVVVSGVLLIRRHPLGMVTAAGQLVWLALTCLPILATVFVADARGREAGWGLLAPIGVLCAVTVAVLLGFLRRVRA
ncbi:hypothetical protein [Nocardioides sp. zg-DK7169]|uniref:hypothetical protein n=1 Tax=Nocardioides sp. zg-DK7169 TaxID=2736600 RepID=UPI001551BEC6|nr:hypothetical protein [Nocardioides sp. zg-DK7169]NPC96858.1 hypothetical protein [Nocardioides sp. zg-DK7169]